MANKTKTNGAGAVMPTPLNLFTLMCHVRDFGVTSEGHISNRIESTSVNGMKRCRDAVAPLFVVEEPTNRNSKVRLTAEGVCHLIPRLEEEAKRIEDHLASDRTSQFQIGKLAELRVKTANALHNLKVFTEGHN